MAKRAKRKQHANKPTRPHANHANHATTPTAPGNASSAQQRPAAPSRCRAGARQNKIYAIFKINEAVEAMIRSRALARANDARTTDQHRPATALPPTRF